MYTALVSTFFQTIAARACKCAARVKLLLPVALILGLPVLPSAPAIGSPTAADRPAADRPAADRPAADRKEPFLGVYEAIPLDKVLPGNLKDRGNLDDLSLTPAMAEQQKSVNLRWDAAKNCRIVGPVRMMAMDQLRFELTPTPTGGFFMIYKNVALGHLRRFEFASSHPPVKAPLWLGNSIARWQDNETFVVDTIDFNDQTWLNSKGALHSDKLHMLETYHLLSGGEYLRLDVTIDDPGALAKPFSYVRYFQRQTGVLGQYYCVEDGRQN